MYGCAPAFLFSEPEEVGGVIIRSFEYGLYDGETVTFTEVDEIPISPKVRYGWKLRFSSLLKDITIRTVRILPPGHDFERRTRQHLQGDFTGEKHFTINAGTSVTVSEHTFPHNTRGGWSVHDTSETLDVYGFRSETDSNDSAVELPPGEHVFHLYINKKHFRTISYNLVDAEHQDPNDAAAHRD